MSQKLRSIPSFASDPRTRERSGRQALRLLSCLSLAGAAACGQVIDSVENGEVAFPGAGGDSRDGVVRTKDGDQAFKYETIDGQAVYQGDILIKAGDGAQEDAILAGGYWPGCVVPYQVDGALTNQQRVQDAIQHWQGRTAVRFVPRTNQRNYVKFQGGSGCSSYLGMVGGEQVITLAEGCSTGNTIHEIGHAVGFYHEQSRADRDNFITVNWNNIQPGRQGNFEKYAAGKGIDAGPFDFSSIMLYGSYAFAKGSEPTLVRKDGTTFAGQRDGLSTGNITNAQNLCTSAIKPGNPLPSPAWHTGTVPVGEEQHWIWNNAGSFVYQVGFSPSDARTNAPCEFQVTRTWDVQPEGGGNRQFHFTIKNVGPAACGATILLQSQAPATSWQTAQLAPGGTQGWTWNNANPLSASHFVNIAPSGATSTTSCDFEVIRSYYTQLQSGERKYSFIVKNVGATTCTGTVLLGTSNNVGTSWDTGRLEPGAATGWFWNNANPVNRVYVPGLSPEGATSTPCQLALTPTLYQQWVNADGSVQRRYQMGVKNVGSIACGGKLLLNHMNL